MKFPDVGLTNPKVTSAKKLFTLSTTVPKVFASLPRWILATRTPFAAFLSRTFHIKRCGQAPASVVFPLPLADFGLFRGGGPKRSVRKWTSLIRKRVRHIFIVALNFLYGGPLYDQIASLGRRPNAAQIRVHQRLWSLIITCETPGNAEVPLVPGRSGTEFIARLLELEHFAESSPWFAEEHYGGGPEDLTTAKIGVVEKIPDALPFEPYSNLNSKRLKLVGSGNWRLEDYLEDELWLPYVEPKVLHHDSPLSGASGPNLTLEDAQENLSLALIWDAKGLLQLSRSPPHKEAFTRIFNARKDENFDRQIGDRRFQNFCERSVQGQSKFLPAGYLLTSVHVPRGWRLRGSITDRKDFYHQAEVTYERACTNCLPFCFPEETFQDTAALRDLCTREASARKGRNEAGDQLGFRKTSKKSAGACYPLFGSLLQGDHLGVEFALSSHSTLLKRRGLLVDAEQIQGGKVFPLGPVYQGLCIDDFFIIAAEPTGIRPEQSQAHRLLKIAQDEYEDKGVLGSIEKDVRASDHFKVIGAEINASEKALSCGLVTASAPTSKRAALAVLSLRAARLPVISIGLAARLAGNWTSVLLYRRCLTCLLSELYQISSKQDASLDDVVALPRSCAQELTLCAVFGFLAVSDLTADFDTRVYATDASLRKGAVCSRPVSPDVSKALWLTGDKKGAYTQLDPPTREILRAWDIESQDSASSDPSFIVDSELPGPSKSMDFIFDFVEVCGGAASVSKALAAKGYDVMPPIELSDSPHFDLRNIRLVEWLAYMLQTKKLKSTMVEPVCTTFSPAAHPSVRSYAQPKGYNLKDPKTMLGNLIAFRCIFLAWLSSLYGAPTLLEQPRLSKMAWLSVWRFLLRQKGFQEAVVASCQFGSIHRKEFRLLTFGIDVNFLQRKCPGGHSHVPIAGAYTKPSAIYVKALAEHFAEAFHRALCRKRREEALEPKIGGIESVIANDLLRSGVWRTDLQWFWTSPNHINVLESHAFLALLKRKALEEEGQRFSTLIDSRVAKCSLAKGRSSARALGPSLKKAAAVQVGFGLYPSFGYAPTKLNIADDPTREAELRDTSSTCFSDLLPPEVVSSLNILGFSRIAASWVRIVILASLVLPSESYPLDAALSLRGFGFDCWDFCLASSLAVLEFLNWLLPFSAWILPVIALFSQSWILLCRWPLCAALLGISLTRPHLISFGVRTEFHGLQPLPLVLMLSGAEAMPLSPVNAEERAKAGKRAETVLQQDRVVRQQTRNRRELLLKDFEAWLVENVQTTLADLVDSHQVDAEHVSDILAAYGRAMFYSGKSYGRYSETINAIAARRPFLKRSLISAWDVAFSWITDEPHVHHPAMPLAVVLAFGGLALLWGWPVEASIILMTWSGILRIGEVFLATRRDLILPCDAVPGIHHALLQIRQPKTRGSHARHQSARIDPQDLVRLLTAVFKRKPREERLWTMSPSTMRKRFTSLQKSLGLPTEKLGRQVPYDLASLRAGGATHLLQRFEDAELVRRRGRWLSAKVCEIYLQEVSVATFAEAVPQPAYERITRISAASSAIVEKATYFLETGLPPEAWPHLW